MTNLLYILIPVLMQVESSNNDKAVGDNGRSVGCLQIGQAVLDDVNRIYGTEYTRYDCFDRTMSREICFSYLNYWGCKYEDATGVNPDYEVYSRIWNGGPNGWARKSTEAYWRKVEKLLEWRID